MKKMVFPVTDEYREKLEYGFAGVGCCYEQEHVRRPGGRRETEWIYPYYQWIGCRRGAGEVILDGRRYSVGEGQGMLLFPNEPHEYYAKSESWEVDWVVFSGSGVDGFIRKTLGIERSRVYTVTAPHMISDRIVRLYETASSDDPMKFTVASGIVYEILLYIYICAFRSQGGSLFDRAERLRPVFGYIDAHYGEQIPLGTLSELIGVTPQHLCIIFRELTGATVTEYVNGVRIGKSKELLLRERGLRVKEIAAACGFSDVSYFCSVFKRLEGVTPTEFRLRG